MATPAPKRRLYPVVEASRRRALGWDMTDNCYDNTAVTGGQHGFPDALARLDLAGRGDRPGIKTLFRDHPGMPHKLNMDIRRLQMADAPEYRAFRLRGLREHPDAFTSSFEEENLRPLAYTEGRLGTPMTEKIWGAFANGALAGMVGLSHETRVKNRHKAALVSLYVASEFTGRGLGRALVDTVLQDARTCGVELVVLTVTDSNQAACALYAQAGFSAFGVEPDAIRVDGIRFGKRHMLLQLPAP